jgi:integrase
MGRKAKNIYLRGSIWWIRYSHRGKQVRESSHSTVYAAADRLLKKRHGDIVTGKFAGLEPDRITMLELFKEVEQDCRDNLRSSLPQLLSRLKNHLIPALGNVRAAELSSDHIKRYRSKRLTEGAARATINREVETLQRAWKLAQMCDPPRVNRTFYFPMYEEHNIRTGFLEEDGYGALHAALPGYLKPLLLIAYHVPCRRGELIDLLMGQLDFRANEIVLNPGETKNKEGRHMPMFGPMRECLLMQKSIRDQKFGDCPYVFFGEKGDRIVDFRKAWKSACKRAGVDERLIFHDLRRSAARNMRRAGIPENTIMKIAGWKTPNMFRRYDIQDGRDIRHAAEIMENRLAEERAISTISSTVAAQRQKASVVPKSRKRLN